MDADRLHRNNCITFAMQGILFAIGFVFFDTSGILPRFVKEITGSDVLAGVPQMLRLISTTLFQVLTIGTIRRVRNVRRYLTGFMLTSYLAPAVVVATLLFDATGAVIMAGLFLSLLIMWCSDGCMVISYYTVFSRTVRAGARSTVNGIMQTVGGIGGIGSSLVIKVLLDSDRLSLKMSYALIFLIGLVVLALAALAFSFTKDTPPQTHIVEGATLRGEFSKLKKVLKTNRSFVLILITQVFFTISTMTVPHLLNMFEAELQVGSTDISTFLNFQSVGIMLGGLIPVFCGKKFGNGFLVFFYSAASFLCGLISVVCVAAHLDGFVLLALISVCGGITTCSWVAFYNVIIDVSGKNEVPVLMLGNSILSLFLSVATVVGGMIITYIGYMWVFSIALACALFGILLSVWTMLSVKKRKNEELCGNDEV